MKPFRVLQFNMQFAQVWDERDPDRAPKDITATLAEIRRHDADIIHLQEVEQARPAPRDSAPPPTPNFDALRAGLPAYDTFLAFPKPDPRELPFGVGLAIFSKTPLRDTFAEDLPSPPIEFDFYGEKKTPTDRLLIGATTTLQGRDLHLLNTHLLAFFMLKTSSQSHPGQRQRIAEHLRNLGPDRPAILTGDFNVRDHVGLCEQFRAEGFLSVQTECITWRRLPYVLDHIFYNRPLRCISCQVVPTPASDHHALIADFVWA